MTSAVPSTLSAGQVFIFARNVNDKRVIQEARDLIAEHGVDPDNVAAITFQPPVGGRSKARLVFTVYRLDEDGKRSAVLADGSPYFSQMYDEDDQVAWHWLTEAISVAAKRELPGWWSQALRTEAMAALEAEL